MYKNYIKLIHIIYLYLNDFIHIYIFNNKTLIQIISFIKVLRIYWFYIYIYISLEHIKYYRNILNNYFALREILVILVSIFHILSFLFLNGHINHFCK